VSQAAERARAFVEGERAFRLGELLTEAFHPKTCELSQVMAEDVRAGIRLLQSVDQDIPAALGRIFAQDSFGHLVQALGEAISAGRRVFFTGCGATGRLSILLEAAWREFWRGQSRMEDLCVSVMAGGDFALIKSVEGFEDFPDFGRRQLWEAGVQRGDVVIAITEGGETPFVIGTVWQGLEAGAKVFFVYNNPTGLLRRHVQRSREVLDEPRIEKLDLATGPMALAGSTRMQAVTTELLVIGAALEMAVAQMVKHAVHDTRVYHRLFEKLLAQLSSADAVEAMARAVLFEERVYRGQGLVTYVADSVLLDVLTDTTERSPTFMVPPFRRRGAPGSPVSGAFVKDPHRPTRQAWREMLGREPRGLTWGRDVYQQLNAPAALQADPPRLDNDEIYKFQIGNEPDCSRVDAPDSTIISIGAGQALKGGVRSTPYARAGFKKKAAITVGPGLVLPAVDEHFHVACDLPASPLRLWEHLAVKLVLNTISTATMVRMGRVMGNAMVWVSPSNKKLIDRGTRLIAQATGLSYEQACEALHEAMEEVARRSRSGETAPSPVALAIGRLSGRP
jgi:N-acetylmuramic acid 6-phosphate etherase